MMKSADWDSEFVGPLLTEDDAFLSNTPSGTLVYRIPSPHVLMGRPQESLLEKTTLQFTIRVQAVSPDAITWLSCQNPDRCRITF